MALDIIKTAETIHALEVFMDKRRPPENIRHEIDLDYKIENQSITSIFLHLCFNFAGNFFMC